MSYRLLRFLCLLSLLALIGILSLIPYFNARRVSHFNAAVSVQIERINLIQTIHGKLQQSIDHFGEVRKRPNLTTAPAMRDLEEALAALQQLRKLSPPQGSPEEAGILDHVQHNLQRLRVSFFNFTEEREYDHIDSGIEQVTQLAQVESRRADDSLNLLTHQALRQIGETLNAIEGDFKIEQAYTAAGAVVGLILAGLIAITLRRGLQKQLHPFFRALDDMTDGKYKLALPPESHDEIGQLATKFGKFSQVMHQHNTHQRRECEELEKQLQELGQERRDLEAEKKKSLYFFTQSASRIQATLDNLAGFAQILYESNNPSEQKRCNQILLTESENLQEQIHDILDAQQLKAGTWTSTPQQFCSQRLIGRITAYGQACCEQQQLTFNATLPSDLPTPLQGDARRWRQLLIHLITGAAHSMDSGTLKLDISYSNQGLHQLWVECRLSIQGPLKSPRRLEQLFGRPQFGALPETQAHEDDSLGIVLMQSLAERLGGELIPLQDELSGPTMRLRLPFERDDRADR